jgi:uncharacterized membrane protein YbhN (UPF0104 family)
VPKRAKENRLSQAAGFASRAVSLRPEDPRMRRALQVSIAVLLGFGVSLALIATLNQLPDVDWRFRPGWLLLGVLGFLLHVIATAEIWRRLLSALGPGLPPGPAIAIWCSSALGRYVPTSLLLPVIRMAMAEREGVPKRICMASIVYEVALGFTAAVVVGAYFVINLPDLQGVSERYAILGFPVLAFLALHPSVFRRWTDRVLRRLGRESLPVVLPVGRVLEFVALYAAMLAATGLGVYAFAQAIYEIDRSDLVIVVGAYSVATAIALAAFILPGGVGAREAGIALALSPVMPTAPAVAVAVLVRIGQLGAEVVLASLSPVLLRMRPSEGKHSPSLPDGVSP